MASMANKWIVKKPSMLSKGASIKVKKQSRSPVNKVRALKTLRGLRK